MKDCKGECGARLYDDDDDYCYGCLAGANIANELALRSAREKLARQRKRVEIKLITGGENLLASAVNAEVRENPQTPFVYYRCSFILDEAMDGKPSNIACLSCHFEMVGKGCTNDDEPSR